MFLFIIGIYIVQNYLCVLFLNNIYSQIQSFYYLQNFNAMIKQAYVIGYLGGYTLRDYRFGFLSVHFMQGTLF